MNKLRRYMILFCVLLTLPLAFVAWRTYRALDRETQSQVRFFSERLMDQIEGELAELVRREESRAVDEYRHTMVKAGEMIRSPLAQPPTEPYVLGYFQNNPDGSFQTPLVEDVNGIPSRLIGRVKQLQAVNAIFNRRKFAHPSTLPAIVRRPPPADTGKEARSSFSERYLKQSASKKEAKAVLGQAKARVEEITADQAMNLEQRKPGRAVSSSEPPVRVDSRMDEAALSAESGPAAPSVETPAVPRRRQTAPAESTVSGGGRFQVEVAPLQAVAIDDSRMFIFRRIGIQGQIFRQGFVLDLRPFLDHLLTAYYESQPIARYTRLTLTAAGQRVTGARVGPTGDGTTGERIAARTFPVPFGFLAAEMNVVSLPPSPARTTFTLVLAMLGVVMVVGLAAIYHHVRAVLDLSERRSRFVSAVTHELKTPLTNIRMYIEMLEAGIAATPEREQAYLGILTSESTRLSGLINNVLELSRLEKKTRRFNLATGDLSDVLGDVQAVMAERLAREGFELTIHTERLPSFAYDREVLVQVLINLMENSVKFGRHLPDKHITIAAQALEGWVKLSVSDSGPGIPKRSVRQVFDDFYRVDNEPTRSAGGTGIGLALVKKFVMAMGGRVAAENNDNAGCTITLSLPLKRQPESV